MRSPPLGHLRLAGAMAVAAALAALVLYIKAAGSPGRTALPPAGGGPSAAASAPRFESNESCFACHAEIAAECAGDAHARAWIEGPFFPRDPKRTECSSCHAPEPILEVGLDRPIVVRKARHEEGVGCIECHRKGDAVRGPQPSGRAACNPVQDGVFTRSEICAPCHAAHGSIDEWKASSWGARGVTCQECHMPAGERAGAGGETERTRSHRMLSQRDPAFLRRSVTVTATVTATAQDGDSLVISILNDGVGHSFPGEIFNREVFLETEVLDASGQTLLERRESIRAPERQKRATEPTTQIRAGERRTYAYALPVGWRRVRSRLGYKLFFLDPDRRATAVWDATLDRP